MREVIVSSYARTPIGKFGGVFKHVSATELGTIAVKEALQRANIDKEKIDEVIMGVVWQAGLKANPARQVAVEAGVNIEAPAVTLNQQCSSGIRALDMAADQIRLGKADVVLAGGFESMSNVPFIDLARRWGAVRGAGSIEDSLYYDGLDDAFSGENMGNTAETVGNQSSLTRDEIDMFALRSQQKARKAISSSRFETEIVPVTVKTKKGETVITEDECPRPNSSLEVLNKLPSVFTKNGLSTAGNSPPLSDGGAALILMDKQYAQKNDHPILGKIVDAVSVSVPPEIMGYGPVPAVKKLLQRNNLNLEDIDLFEINEAFGAQVLACIKELNIPTNKVNVNGGAIALGHPPGNTGARLVGTLLTELKLQNKKYGIATLCAGGGPAIAMLVSTEV